jgi:putative ABC transport system permease protein
MASSPRSWRWLWCLRGPRFADQANVRAHYDEVVRRVEALPGVNRAGGVSKLPLYGGTNGSVIVEGREDETAGRDGPLVELSVVTPGYHQAMGIRLLAGRGFEPIDTSRAQPGLIINQTMAERLWPGESPLGQRVQFETNSSAPGGVAPEPAWKTVVGVVEDVRQWGIEQQPIPEAYVPYNPEPPSGMHSFSNVRWLVVHTDVDPASLIPTVRRAALAVAPDQPVGSSYTMTQLVDGNMRNRRFMTLLLSLFAGIALALVAAGVYGVMSYFVAQRNQEIGVRMALGAERGKVLRLVILRTLKLATLGIVLGLAGVYASTRTMASMVYGIGAMDIPTVVGGVLFLMLVAVASSIIPALRATRVDPLAALRTT